MTRVVLWLILAGIIRTTGVPAQEAGDRRSGAVVADTAMVSPMTLSGLRGSRQASPVRPVIFITDGSSRGLFVSDPGDKTTPDDSAMTLVTASGLRYKRNVDQGPLNVRWFGATGKGSADDWYAIQKGINYILNTDAPYRTLYFPPGRYLISRPLLIARFTGKGYRMASINLEGPASSKDLSTGAADIITNFSNSFAIGIELGKGVLIKDLGIRGKFTFPNRLNEVQVDTLGFSEWADGARDNPKSPYAGIVIDPFSDSSAYASPSDMYPGLHAYCCPGYGRGGSTAIQVVGCSISNFIVGVMLTPSNQQNAELIDVIDCDISYNKVGYAMGQAQSKECHVDRLKCWGNMHTLFDNMNYGFHHGDGAAVPLVDGVNIAGHLKQLCSIAAPSHGGVFRNVYAEGLFRVGYVGGAATLSFEDCQFNFAAWGPYPDFFVLGSGASFHGCTFRHYTGRKGMRLVLSGTSNSYEGGIMNEPPVAAIMGDCGTCLTPVFRNVRMYYSGGVLGAGSPGITVPEGLPGPRNAAGTDPIYFGNTYTCKDPSSGIDLFYRFTYHDTYERTVPLPGATAIHVDKVHWTAWFRLRDPLDTLLLQEGDFILTAGLFYQDQFAGGSSQAYPVGFIKRIGHDTVYLQHLAYGIREGMSLYLWMDYYLNGKPPFTGDMAAGSNLLTKEQGYFPLVGERVDMPMLASGTYVAAVDPAARTLRFSTANQSGRSFYDYTFINGYPSIEMHSCYDLPYLLSHHKTLIGGARFYLHENMGKDIHEPSYILEGRVIAGYLNEHTHIGGDTTLHPPHFSPSLPISQ